MLVLQQISYDDLPDLLKGKTLQEQVNVLKYFFGIKEISKSGIDRIEGSSIDNTFIVQKSDKKEGVFIKDKGVIKLGNERFFDKIVVAVDSTGFRYIKVFDKGKYFCYEYLIDGRVVPIKDIDGSDLFESQGELTRVVFIYLARRHSLLSVGGVLAN